MTQARRERADAVRNRRAILQATEELLTRFPPDQISMEQIAAAAGVGKGTVFHRFGSRMGLMVELMRERAFALEEAVTSGSPPLGPKAPPRERLLAFLDGLVGVIARNKGLLAALGHAAATVHKPQDGPHDAHPIYQFWHGHVSGLIAEERPDLDADVLAHLLLGSVHHDPLLALVERGEGSRLADAMCTLAGAVLDAPASTAASGDRPRAGVPER